MAKQLLAQLPAIIADQSSPGVLLLLHQVISPHSKSLLLFTLVLGMLLYVHATPVHALTPPKLDGVFIAAFVLKQASHLTRLPRVTG